MNDQLKVREAFEAHMRKLNPCTRFHRQSEKLGGFYRTVTVERSWQLWQAALAHASSARGEECSVVGDAAVAIFVEKTAQVISGAPFPSARSYAKARKVSDLALKLYTHEAQPASDATTNPQESSSRLVDAAFIHCSMVEENNHIADMADLATDAERWRHVSKLAWFVDAAARVFDIAGKPWEPRPYDEDDIVSLIDQAIAGRRGEAT